MRCDISDTTSASRRSSASAVRSHASACSTVRSNFASLRESSFFRASVSRERRPWYICESVPLSSESSEHVERAGERHHVHLAVRAREEMERGIDLLHVRRSLGRAIQVLDHLVEIEGLSADSDRNASGVFNVHRFAVRVRRRSAIAADVLHILVYELTHLLAGQRLDGAGA